MSTPVAVKVSSELADSARKEAEVADRSLTGQIEHWAKLGRAAEGLLPSRVASALKRSAGDIEAIDDNVIRERILEALAAFQTLDAETIRRKAGIDQQIRFESDPSIPNGMTQIHPDGRRIRGRMDGRRFIPLES